MELLSAHEVRYVASRWDHGHHRSSGFDVLTESETVWILHKDPGDLSIVADPNTRNQDHSTYIVPK